MSTVDLYGWELCDHSGIGQIGCPTCDPDKGRVMIRMQRLDNRDLRQRIAELERACLAARTRIEELERDAKACSDEEEAQKWLAIRRSEELERQLAELGARVPSANLPTCETCGRVDNPFCSSAWHLS